MKYTQQEDAIIKNGVIKKKNYEDISFELKTLGFERTVEAVRLRYRLLRKNDPTLEPMVYNSQNNIKSIVENDEPKFIVDKQDNVSWKYRHGTIELKLEHLDDIFYRYSRHGLNMSQVKVQNQYGFTAIQWQSLKRTFDLVKDSDVFSPYSISLVSEKDACDMISNKIAEKYSPKNMRAVIEYEDDKQKRKAFDYAIKKNANQEYQRQLFEQALLDYVTPATHKYISVVNRKASGDPIAITVQDIHIGAEVMYSKNLPAYNDEIVIRRLDEVALETNKMNSSSVTICINGDIIESFTGLNHINSWKGIGRNGYGTEVTIKAIEILSSFIEKIHNVNEVLIVSGNHDRTTSNNNEDVTGEVVRWIQYVLNIRFGSLFNVEWTPDVMVRKLNGLGIIWTHGHLSISKRNPSEIINLYGLGLPFNLIMEGHLHTRKIKYDSANGRSYVGSSIFSGNTYSKQLGFSTLPGFTIVSSKNGYPIVVDIPINF